MEIRRRPPNPKVRVAHLEYAVPHDDEALQVRVLGHLALDRAAAERILPVASLAAARKTPEVLLHLALVVPAVAVGEAGNDLEHG